MKTDNCLSRDKFSRLRDHGRRSNVTAFLFVLHENRLLYRLYIDMVSLNQVRKGQISMKKLIPLFWVLLMLVPSVCPALADAPAPVLPEGDLQVIDVKLNPDLVWEVYTGPGLDYSIASNGKARVSTTDWVQVLGGEDWSRILVQYAVNDHRLRIGWIDADALKEEDHTYEVCYAPGESYRWQPCHLNWACPLTDDPLLSQTSVVDLPALTKASYLCRMGDWAMIDVETSQGRMRGFVLLDAITLEAIDLNQNPNFTDAAALLERAGIAATPRGIKDNTIYFDLQNGGTFWYYYYGHDYSAVLTPLEFNCKLEHATDEDVGKYLTEALTMLAQVDDGIIDNALPYPWADVKQARETTVSNGLIYQEYLGEQGLRVLLDQLAAHDGNDRVNSLRAQLASRLLGVKDNTNADPREGCAWYDALQIARQNALKPADAGVYVQDPILRAATQLLIDHYGAEYAEYPSNPEVDTSKCVTVVALGECAREQKGTQVTLWANGGHELIALYNDRDIKLSSGSWYPLRLTMEQQPDGSWRLVELVEPEDGDYYESSILRMCNGDKQLAERMYTEPFPMEEAVQKVLASQGYPDAARIDR